jgi:hypothetical protein
VIDAPLRVRGVCFFCCLGISAQSASVHGDTPADSCTLFARAEGTPGIGEFKTVLNVPGVVLRVCGRDNSVTRAYVRSAPVKAGDERVCKSEEAMLTLETPPPTATTVPPVLSERSSVLGSVRTYLSWAPGTCPRADSDQYVLAEGVSPKDFELSWSWWTRFRVSPDEQHSLRQKATVSNARNDRGAFAEFWNALSNKSVIFRSVEADVRHGTVGDLAVTLSIEGKMDPLYRVTLHRTGDGELHADDLRALFPYDLRLRVAHG